MSENPFAYPAAGNVMVLGDGPEMLVYSGSADAPLWKHFADDVVVGVGATAAYVMYVDGRGDLTYFNVTTAEIVHKAELGRECTGMCVAPDGAVAVLTPQGLVIVKAGMGPLEVVAPSPLAATFGVDSSALAVGMEGGGFTVLDGNTGSAKGSQSLGAPVTGVAWSARGYWLAVAGYRLYTISADGKKIEQNVDLFGVGSHIAVSRDGGIGAIVVDQHRINIFELVSRTLTGHLQVERVVQGIGFGVGSWLGIGLDNGDCNRIELLTGRLTKSIAHPGRQQVPWRVDVQVEKAKLRGAVATSLAGGQPLAREIAVTQEASGMWKAMAGGCSAIFMGIVFILGCIGGSWFIYMAIRTM